MICTLHFPYNRLSVSSIINHITCCRHTIISPCYYTTMPPYHHATMLLYHHVTMPTYRPPHHRHHITMSPCQHITMTSCHHINGLMVIWFNEFVVCHGRVTYVLSSSLPPGTEVMGLNKTKFQSTMEDHVVFNVVVRKESPSSTCDNQCHFDYPNPKHTHE